MTCSDYLNRLPYDECHIAFVKICCDSDAQPTWLPITKQAICCFRLLERQKLDNGNKWPETIAVVLWGTDNIKTYGESLAQVPQVSVGCT